MKKGHWGASLGFLGSAGGAGFACPLALKRLIIRRAAGVVASGANLACVDVRGFVSLVAAQVRPAFAKAIAQASLGRSEAWEKPITMNGLAIQAGVTATTLTRLAGSDEKAASALSLALTGRIVAVLDCGIEDLLEVVEA